MHFPNELVLLIIQSSEGQGLKSARLVSKTWCSYASIFLFKRIYVAPNKLDLQVFNIITQHPIFSKHIRELVYDDAEFMPHLEKEGYIRGLRKQTIQMFDEGKSTLQGPDPQINEWASDVARTDLSFVDLVAKWEHRDLICAGYRKYQVHSVYQKRKLRGGDYYRSLVEGLSRLEFLESVTLGGGWPIPVLTSPCEHHHGTPLARGWNRFHCLPHARSWQPVWEYDMNLSGRLRPHQTINTALVGAQIHMGEFTIGRNCVHGMKYPETIREINAARSDPLSSRTSPEISEINDPIRPSALSYDTAAFSGPARLHLRLGSCDEGASALHHCDNIAGLEKLLSSMHVLRRPDLNSSSTLDHHPSRYLDNRLASAYHNQHHPSLYMGYQIYPSAMTYESLTEVTLHNFASSATNLLCVLLLQMPNLKHVELGPTRLLQGSWESVIECLRQFNHFTSFQYRGECIHGCDNSEINDYIMHGGRHPCLLDEQPTHASEAYMLEIDRPLRQAAYLLWQRRMGTHVAT